MMRKIFGIKSISHLIYGLLMLAPILAIGVKCGYVMLNKNANQSYSDNKISSIKELNVGTTFIDGETYIASYDTNKNTGGQTLYFSSSNVDFPTLFSVSNVDAIALYNDGRAYTYYWNGTTYVNNSGKNNYWGVDLLSFQYIYYRYDSTPTTINNNGYVKTSLITLTTNKLDNVFYYAIDEIIQNNNFGKINFTGWFDNMMLDNNIQINQTYTHLFNWYLNYTLFISCAYILWLVLMWFVNFARKLLDRGMNYDW